MPIYEYQCQKCQEHFEVVQTFKDKPLKKCTACGGKLQKLISHSSFHLKGSGWYVTDYARKGQKEQKEKTEKKDGEPKPEKTSESTSSSKADNKPEKKKETAGTKD